MKRPITAAVAVALLVALLSYAPASAGSVEAVTLHVQADPKLLAAHEPFEWTLTLEWDDVAALNTTGVPNALDLLAFVAAQEGSTYTASWHDLDSNGSLETAFIDEVNDVHTDFTLILVGYFWALYEDGVSSESGINLIELQPGLALDIVYTGFPADA